MYNHKERLNLILCSKNVRTKQLEVTVLLQEETVMGKHKYSDQLGGDDKQKVEYLETQVKKLQKYIKQLEVQLRNVQVG